MKPKAILTLVKYGAAVAVGAFGAGLIALWSLIGHGISARETPSGLESFVAPRLRNMAIPGVARAEKNPVAADPAMLREAMEHFADHCATCHANDGSGNAPIGKGLYPKPPDMRAAATQDLTDGELFYIIHNGVRLTGMPAFGRDGDPDEASWKLVHFIRHLPSLTVEEIEAMKDLNPKTPADLKEEEELQRFLRGETDAPSGHAGHSEHH